MNCLANILHKICNASVFFSAYRICYNSIVKIEQKHKSAFFEGALFVWRWSKFHAKSGMFT